MVGGRIIEMRDMRLENGETVVRIWVKDTRASDDELAVYAEPADALPNLGDEVWWQAGKIYFDGDRQHLRKVGYSFDPRRSE